MAVEPQHDLLVRHFVTWAEKKQRDPDRDLLGELLHLREVYDDLEPTYWPSGSVEHLLLERWPSKSQLARPEPDAVVETLDAFVRFLRSTGRMSARSAAPAELAKEARRAASRMAQASADPANWSPTKVLIDFGRQIGIDLDDAPDEQTLQARLDEITATWNALPQEERRRRMPMPGDDADEDLSEEQRAMRRFGVDDGLIALLLTYNGRLPEGELPAAEEVAPYFRDSPFLQQVLALARWVGEGREITATRVLRPAIARQAYDDLGLGAWQRGQLERYYCDERWAGVAAVGRETWIQRELDRPWRSAGECDELHRLWLGAVGCGLIALEGKRAIARLEEDPTPERWIELGVRAGVATLDGHLGKRHYTPVRLVRAMLESYVNKCGPVSKAEVAEWSVRWSDWPSDIAYFTEHGMDLVERQGPSVNEAFGLLGDTGLYVESDDSLALTPAGDVFVTAWLDYMEG